MEEVFFQTISLRTARCYFSLRNDEDHLLEDHFTSYKQQHKSHSTMLVLQKTQLFSVWDVNCASPSKALAQQPSVAAALVVPPPAPAPAQQRVLLTAGDQAFVENLITKERSWVPLASAVEGANMCPWISIHI
jgi:hypothetical protein